MPAFAYRAANAAGRTQRGMEEAASEDALTQSLARRGLYAVEVRRTGTGEDERRRRPLFVSARADVSDLMSTFSALLQAGLPLDRSLEIAGRGAARADVSEAIAAARKRVREGGHLADALAAHPHLFPSVVVGLVRAAESGGHLTAASVRLAEYLEREKALRSKLTSAMVYPLLLVLAGGGAMGVLLLFVLPRFVDLLQDSGNALPRSTAFLIAVSGLLTRTWPILALAGFAGVGALIAWRSTEEGRERSDAMLLRAPILGSLRARHASARLAHVLSTLLSGGLPLLPALEIVQGTVGDAAVAADVRAARDAVRRGEALSAALGRGRAFSHSFIRLVEVGEETGTLDSVLARTAAMLEGELERRLERVVALVEPALIVVFGGVVGFVALALFQSVYGIQAGTL